MDTEAAGLTYATYGGVYIVSAACWLWLAEGIRPDRWDMLGTVVCLRGAVIILFGPRSIA